MKKYLLTLAAIWICGCSTPSGIQSNRSVTVGWDPPTTNEDGSPLTDLAGYNVYVNGSLVSSNVVINQYTWQDWPFKTFGSNNVTVTAFNSTGQVSVHGEKLWIITGSRITSIEHSTNSEGDVLIFGITVQGFTNYVLESTRDPRIGSWSPRGEFFSGSQPLPSFLVQLTENLFPNDVYFFRLREVTQ